MVASLSSKELAAAVSEAKAETYAIVRRIAAEQLAAGTAAPLGIDAEALSAILIDRDLDDPRMRLLESAEKEWALTVVAITGRVLRSPYEAVDDARRRGVTWKALGEALGVTAPAVRDRFARRDGGSETPTEL